MWGLKTWAAHANKAIFSFMKRARGGVFVKLKVFRVL